MSFTISVNEEFATADDTLNLVLAALLKVTLHDEFFISETHVAKYACKRLLIKSHLELPIDRFQLFVCTPLAKLLVVA